MRGADPGRSWRLRGYTVERLLGSGSSGDVWRARVSGTGAAVALKRIHVDGIGQLQHAEREAALLTALDHPQLVRLHSFVPTDDAAVLVLDLAEGGSLADLLGTRGRLTPGEVITAIAPVAAALAYLHGEGVVHGDVSAANVLFTPDGVAMLSDVGVARLIGDRGEAACTPAYVDPTVASGGVPGPPSDVFSLAAVALHALTGAPPWVGDDAEDVLAQAGRGGPDDSLRIAEQLDRAGVSMAMAAVLCRALAMDPHRRGTAADLALDLRHSGQPVAVELSAGRRRADIAAEARRPVGPRHAARVGAPPTVSPTASAAAESAGRPGFERPTASPVETAAPPPTRMVGLRPRPVVPRPRRGVRSLLGRRLVLLGCAALTAVLLAAGGTVWAATRSGPPVDRHGARAQPDASRPHSTSPSAHTSTSSSAARSPTTQPTQSTQSTRSTRSTQPTPTVAPPTALPRSPHEAVAVLAALDAIRADAFRRRAVGLLAKVYVAGPLRAADTAMVRQVVPRGCGLLGARTRYSDVRIQQSGARVVVTATATLARSRLVCGAATRGTAPGAGPTRLRVELARTITGVRIAAQRAA